MRDRDLLKLAAGAARVNGEWVEFHDESTGRVTKGVGAACAYVTPWNSLANDGDCARLETACGIGLSWADDHVVAMHPKVFKSVVVYFHAHEGDKNAARRYASTLAAAEIMRARYV